MKEDGWVDLWRLENPNKRTYLWSASGRGSLSQIYMVLGNEKVQSLLHSVTYMPRLVSDHTPVMFKLKIGPRGRIHPYWLKQIGFNDRVPEQIEVFLEAHGDNKMDGMTWDTFKAFLRGALKSTISYIKRPNRQEEEELTGLCAQAEADFIDSPSNNKQIRWEGLMRQYRNQLAVNAKWKIFFF